jgi:hypothetical protein
MTNGLALYLLKFKLLVPDLQNVLVFSFSEPSVVV